MTVAASPTEGHIVTFYSYKGGTGRSMALANVAWILASCGKRVAVIDWDLEAPGIHRYFHPFLRDKQLTSSEGLMEFLLEYVSQALTPRNGDHDDGWFSEHADLVEYAQSLRWSQFPSPGTIDFIPAGRQTSSYATTVNLFNWNQFYDKLAGERFFDEVKKHLQSEYDYVLIDSRTGVSDTSGICTIQMPETVVLCFTLNTQSIEGAAAVADTIVREQQRRGRKIRLLPVPTRVERSEKERLELARVCAWQAFDRFLLHLTPAERSTYWADAEVPYEPYYAFEEILATFGDRTRVRTSVLVAMETLARHVTGGMVTSFPSITDAERTHVLAQYLRREKPPETEEVDVANRGESAMARLVAADQARAMATLLRLTELKADGTLAPRRARRADLGNVDDRVMQALRYGNLVRESKQNDGAEFVELSTHAILTDWTRLQRAVEEDRTFLQWRQSLAGTALLKGSELVKAQRYRKERPADFNSAELKLIAASSRRRISLASLAAVALVLVFAGVLAWAAWRDSDRYQLDRVYEDVPVSRVDDSVPAENAVARWMQALVGAGKIQQAEAVASVGTLAQKAMRHAVLANALHERNLMARATTAVEASTAALAGIQSPLEQARAQVDVADILASGFRETATRLLFEARKSVTEREPQLAADVIVALQRMGIQGQARQLYSDLPRLPADWRFDLADRVEQAGGKPLATEIRRDALPLRTDFLTAVRALTQNGDAENCALILETLHRLRLPNDSVYKALAMTLRALARWRTAGAEDPLWGTAKKVVDTLPSHQREEMRATLAAALAACGDTDGARQLLAQVTSAERPDSPVHNALILSAQSEAYCRLGDDHEQGTRDAAIQQALLEPDVSLQSDALMKAAMAAARCGDTAAAARIAAAAPHEKAYEQQLPELMVTIADSARNANDGGLAAAKLIVLLAPKPNRDRALFDAAQSLVAAAKGGAALEVAKAIESEETRYAALRWLVLVLGQVIDSGALHEAGKSMNDPYYGALSLALVAQQSPHSLLAGKALEEAEDRGGSVRPDQKSAVFRAIAEGRAREGQLRRARTAAMKCDDPIDQLEAFAAIVASSPGVTRDTR